MYLKCFNLVQCSTKGCTWEPVSRPLSASAPQHWSKKCQHYSEYLEFLRCLGSWRVLSYNNNLNLSKPSKIIADLNPVSFSWAKRTAAQQRLWGQPVAIVSVPPVQRMRTFRRTQNASWTQPEASMPGPNQEGSWTYMKLYEHVHHSLLLLRRIGGAIEVEECWRTVGASAALPIHPWCLRHQHSSQSSGIHVDERRKPRCDSPPVTLPTFTKEVPTAWKS